MQQLAIGIHAEHVIARVARKVVPHIQKYGRLEIDIVVCVCVRTG